MAVSCVGELPTLPAAAQALCISDGILLASCLAYCIFADKSKKNPVWVRLWAWRPQRKAAKYTIVCTAVAASSLLLVAWSCLSVWTEMAFTL